MSALRSFKSESAMRAAMKKDGFHVLSFEAVRQGKEVRPRFFVHLAEDAAYLKSKGWEAIVDTGRAA